MALRAHHFEWVAALERVPKKLIDFFDKNTLYFLEKRAISYRPDDSIRSRSALEWDEDRRADRAAPDGPFQLYRCKLDQAK
jgi:hypothetical protein